MEGGTVLTKFFLQIPQGAVYIAGHKIIKALKR